MPVLGRYKQHLSRVQHRLSEADLRCQRELLQVDTLCIHLAGVGQHSLIHIQTVRHVWRAELHQLPAFHLTQQVILRVLVQRRHGALRTKPGVDVGVGTLPQTAVLGYNDVIPQLRYLIKQLVLGQISPPGRCSFGLVLKE